MALGAAIAMCLPPAMLLELRAQTLDDASRAALATSLGLKADHERQEGAEARLRGSIDSFMPTISILIDKPLDSKISYSPEPLPSTVGLDAIPRAAPRQYQFLANLPLFDGFKRWNTYQSSRSLVEAGAHLTVSRRQQVLLDTAVAYVAVLRDTKIVGFRTTQIAAATRIADETARQFSVNDATRTDVALTKSRVEQARAVLERATSDLAASRLEFKRLTKIDPDRVSPPKIPANLPATEEAYAQLVRSTNPRLKAARLDVQSAEYLSEAAKADLYPSLNFQASRSSQYGYAPGLDSITDSTARLIARFPIYEPGAFPRIREAAASARQRGYEVEDDELTTVTQARTAFARRKAIRLEMDRLTTRVGELRAAMHGYEIERGAGFRTVIDELNIQAELADAEVAVAVIQTEYDAVSFQLAAAVGLLDVGAGGAAPQNAASPTIARVARQVPAVQRVAKATFKPSWHLKAAIAAYDAPLGLRGTQPAVTASR